MDNVSTKPRGLHYVGNEGDYAVYRYFKGGRAIFEAAVDQTDPELKIYVGKVNATWAKVNDIKDETFTGELFETKGRAWKRDGADHIGTTSVRGYIRPRAFSILANLYVHKPAAVTDAEAMDEVEGDDN